MPAQIKLVGDEVEIAEILRLAGEPLLPMPLLKQLARERIGIGVAFGIETAAWITIPVPGSTEIVGGVEHRCLDPEINQALDLVDPSHARANHNHFVEELRFLRHSMLQDSCFVCLVASFFASPKCIAPRTKRALHKIRASVLIQSEPKRLQQSSFSQL